MKCPRCQHDNPQGARFCEECAAPLARTCSNCGADLSAAAKFCHACAHPVAAGAGTPSRSPDSYTPKYLAEKILTSKSALEGERKQVTVLFVDVSGFTSLSERLDPEEVHGLMTRMFELMLAEVHRYEGTVNQFLGDGIMALFGAPIAHEDHARRAVYAALGIGKALSAYGEEVGQLRQIIFHVRQGVNTGLVVVGSIGSNLRMDYTAVGDTTNVAARLQQTAHPGRIVISEGTYRLVAGYVHARPLGELSLKGKIEPVPAWEVISAREARTRLEVEAEVGLTPFVGRDRERRVLTECFEQAKAGRGQIVFLVGEPGIGKSRLLYEFRRRLGDEATWLEGHSISFGHSIAFHPLIDLFRQSFRIAEGDREETVAKKIEQSVLRLGDEFRPTLPYIRDLLTGEPGEPAVVAMDPAQRRGAMFDAVRRLTVRACEVRPQVVLFEDLHWIDQATEDYLRFVADSIPSSRLLLLLTYRPGYRHPFGERTYHTRLVLTPLSPDSSVQMAEAMLATEALPDALRGLIVRKAEGNPFFLEEIVKSLQESGAMRRTERGFALVEPLDSIQVPDTVQDVITARIDRLEEAAKTTLQVASVIGREFTRRLLEHIADLRGRAEEFLRELTAVELIYEKAIFPELAYVFKHALTQDVAYHSLLVERRKALHRLIGMAIEELYADRLAEHYEVLAYHFSTGEEWQKAIRYHRMAGEKAAARSAHREAVTHLDKALVAAQHVPASRDTVEEMIDLRLDLDKSLLTLAELGRRADNLREAESLAETLGDHYRLARVSCAMASYYYLMGDYDRAVDSGHRTLTIAESLSDMDLQVPARQYLGYCYCAQGEYRQAVHVLKKNVDFLKGARIFERFGIQGQPSLVSPAWLIWSLAELGAFREGTARAEELMEISETVDEPFSRVYAFHGVGHLYVVKGDLHQAIPVLERGVALCHAAYISLGFPFVASSLGAAYVLSARLAEALPLLEQAVERAMSMRRKSYRSLFILRLGEGYLRAGLRENALEQAEGALEVSRAGHERGHEAQALWLLGEIASHGEPPEVDKAEDPYRQAVTLATELGMRPLVAHCHLGLGKLYRRTDKRGRAQEHLNTATTMYREMDMRFWLEKAEAEMKG